MKDIIKSVDLKATHGASILLGNMLLENIQKQLRTRDSIYGNQKWETFLNEVDNCKYGIRTTTLFVKDNYNFGIIKQHDLSIHFAKEVEDYQNFINAIIDFNYRIVGNGNEKD